MRDRQPLAAFAVLLAAASTLSCDTRECPLGTSARGGKCFENLGLETAGVGGLPNADPNAVAANGGGASGAVAAGALGGSSAGPTSGVGAAAAGSPAAGDVCSIEGAVRCALAGAGNRETCVNGVWSAGQPCANDATCVDDRGAASCVVVAELCKGAGGQVVCDERGSLIVCNANGSIDTQMNCLSAKHCEAGKALRTCALCLPDEDFECDGADLRVCDVDGMAFRHKLQCDTAGLCNKMLGKCTNAVCDPSAPSCDGNSLVTCNAAGTAIASMKSCGQGACDAKGGDCNACEPGAKKCQDGLIATCDATGQKYEPAPCADDYTCVGQGKCVECDANDACSGLTKECKIGMCSANKCLAANAPSTLTCKTSDAKDGSCRNGECVCMPKCDGKACGDDGCGTSCGPCSKICTSGGQCVECENNSQCAALTQGCKVGVCQGGACKTQDAPADTRCNRAGYCMGSACVECRADNQCTNGLTCNPNSHTCECKSLMCNGQCVKRDCCNECTQGYACDPKTHECACAPANLCNGKCLTDAQCCTNSDCNSGDPNRLCNSDTNQCECAASKCCKGDNGKSCTTEQAVAGKCDSNGQCVVDA